MTIAVIGSMRFPPENMETVRPYLRQLVAATRANDGCIAYDVGEDIFEPGLLRFSEVWPDQASLDAHLVAPQIAPWREICQANGLSDRDFLAYDADGARPL
jgi:quinol monooxygenase YgiN